MAANVVQSAFGSTQGGSSVTVTLPSPTTTGNALLVVYACFYSTEPYTSIADNASPASAFTASPGDVSLSYQGTLCIASALNITGRSGHQVTVSRASQYFIVIVMEVSGLAASAALDKTQSNAQAVIAITNYTSNATPTTGDPNEFLLGAHSYSNPGTQDTTAATPDAPWQKVAYAADAGFHKVLAQWRTTSTAAGYASTGSAQHFDQNVIATYKTASGAPPDISGTLTSTLGPLVVTASGVVGTAPALGTLTATLGPLAGSASGMIAINATLTQPLGALAVTASGTAALAGTATIPLGTLSVGAFGTVALTASLGKTLGALAVVATGTVANAPPVIGTLSATLGALAVAATGSVSTGAPINASLSATLGALAISGAGYLGPPPPTTFCAPTTLTELQALMQQRWDGVVFWTAEEARLALNEALREWNLLTGCWRMRTNLSLSNGNPELGLPGGMTYQMRVSVSYPANTPYRSLTPSSLAELDLGRPSWRMETTAAGGGVPTRPIIWAPLSLTRIAIWPAPLTLAYVLVDGVMNTPTLVPDWAENVDLNEEIIDVLVDMALHIVAFKEGGARWRATRPLFEAFLQAAAEENSVLKTNQKYRRWAGLDRRRDLQPSTGASNQIEGVAAQFSRHDQSEAGGG